MDMTVTLPEYNPPEIIARHIPNPCCAGGWWLRAEVPSDEDAQPETD